MDFFSIECHSRLVVLFCLLFSECHCFESHMQETQRGRKHFTLRSRLSNCREKFIETKKGRVVFLGGSITNMHGWREMVCDYLHETFADTEFDFMKAGIPSTDSTFGAFRLERDVFSHGPVDLLFIDAAVNDQYNGRNAKEQVRGMEGIIRHARMRQPDIDIIMLHFVDPPKMKDFSEGKVPQVIANHEKVADYYGVSSLNLALEVTERIAAGEFSWEKDFKSLHPSPFGQRLYFESIKKMLEVAWSKSAAMQSYKIPDSPIDTSSYFSGHLVKVENAQIIRGFTYVSKWKPTDNTATREGFVNVPVLAAEVTGAELTFDFTGKAVGLVVVSGPDAGILEYSIDDKTFKKVDLYTPWSSNLHLPWIIMLDAQLQNGKHQLLLKTMDEKNAKSKGYAARIVNFLINE